MRYCQKCGSQVREEDTFCSKCGTPLGNSKSGHIRRAYIGPHPMWSIFSGVMLVLSGFVAIYMLATVFEPLPIPFKLSFILVFVTLIAIGVILFVYGIRGKVIPTQQIEIE
ncbi:MAG TPA: zinc-ribbon domain-containing protein [Candidatus Bathyarchaeia archaeon]